jgi:hypothetical protein
LSHCSPDGVFRRHSASARLPVFDELAGDAQPQFSTQAPAGPRQAFPQRSVLDSFLGAARTVAEPMRRVSIFRMPSYHSPAREHVSGLNHA